MTRIPVPAVGREAAAQRIAAFIISALPGKPLRVTVEAAKRERTDPQNAYLFGVAYPLLVEAKGYPVGEIHEFMCGTHFGWVDRPCPKTPRNPEGLESKPFRTTTTDENGKRDVLDTAAFSKFVDTVQRIAAQAGVFIPDPQKAAA